MIKNLFFILLLFAGNILLAQEWTDPIQISPETMNASSPDLIVDNLGVLHCVWSHQIEDNYRKIYYSKSEDYGETWSEPEDISLNDSLWMSEPHIACDSENNLYLTYDYNTYAPNSMHVLFKKFDGINWSQPDTITIGMLGSDFNKLVVDNNNRIYIFWFKNDKIYYKYLENEIYSEIFCPYNENSDLYFLAEVVSDKNNNLHCIGRYVEEGQSSYENKAIYINYNYSNDLWQEKHFLSENTAWAGSDICMDNTQQPHLTWREPTTDTAPYNDATFYTYFDGSNWTPNEIVVEDPKYQTIAIDNNNRVHIANREKTEIGNQIVHYQKYQDNWEGIILDETYAFYDLKLVIKDNTLFFIYSKNEEGGGESAILVTKYNIPVNTPENFIKRFHELKQNYPNPFKYQTTIHFYLNKGGYTTLKIIDLNGRLITTLINEYKSVGEYNIIWNGTNHNGQKVSPGMYLYRLQVNSNCMTKSLIISN